MSDKPEIPERWQDRWARLGEVYAAFEKQERESGKLWSDIPNPTQYVLDRMEAAESRVRELEQALLTTLAKQGVCQHDYADGDICSKCDMARPTNRKAAARANRRAAKAWSL